MTVDEAVEREWRNRLPGLPVSILWEAIASYMCGDPRPRAEVVAGFIAIAAAARQIDDLNARLCEEDKARLDIEFSLSNVRDGNTRIGPKFWQDLRRLGSAASSAGGKLLQEPNRGRAGAKGWRVRLIRQLAMSLETAGAEISARPNGPLALAYGCVEEYLARNPIEHADGARVEARAKDISGIIRNALRGR